MSTLGKLAAWSIIGIVGYGLATGKLDLGSIGETTASPPVAAKKAAAGSVAEIPADYLALYQANGNTCKGLDWAILAAIGKIESDHGRSRLPGVRSGVNGSGAAGPMQFLAPTWREVRRKHPGVGADIYDPSSSIPAAAWYLCDSGAARDLRKAIWRYNHSNAYVNRVLDQARKYRRSG
jgi:soluble lytic murein transglycosylase-like protein